MTVLTMVVVTVFTHDPCLRLRMTRVYAGGRDCAHDF